MDRYGRTGGAGVKGQKYKLYEIACAHCGAVKLKQRRKDRGNQFCDFECRTEYFRSIGKIGRPRVRTKDVIHVGPAPVYCEVPIEHPSRRRQARRRPRVFVSGGCAWCGETFTIVDQLVARFCSASCARNATESRRGKFRVPTRVRLEIYVRDGWVCQLCKTPVEPSLPPSDEWAATLDHIECQSWALIPDHSPSNLRLAHRWCNSVRGNETYYTAADLVVI